MSDPFPSYYQPDIGTAHRMGQRPKPLVNVDKPIAMKVRVSMPKRPNTATKHYKRKRRTTATYDDRKRQFF